MVAVLSLLHYPERSWDNVDRVIRGSDLAFLGPCYCDGSFDDWCMAEFSLRLFGQRKEKQKL